MRKNSSSYKSILKSTSIVGGAQIVKIIFDIIRSKALALLIGPAGIGLIGAYNSSLQVIQKISGLGISFSAIRDVAKANHSSDKTEISVTVYVLRRVVIITGIFGTLIVFMLSDVLSNFTFGNYEYSLELKFLSVIILLNLVSGGQSALIQGMRRIKDLSKITVIGAVFSTIFSIPLMFFFGIDGIIPFLIMVAATQLFFSWIYAKKVNTEKIKLSLIEIIQKSTGMIKLGLAFMGGGLATAAGLYLIRVIIIRKMDIEAAGYYQAAATLSSIYIGIILDAMAKDFYPRLTAVADNAKESIRIINEQTEIGILLAAPGLLFTLAAAPYLIQLFYSSAFAVSYEILRWMILGIFLRVVSWPLGYLFVARGKGKIYFFTQLIFNVVHVLLIFYLVDFFSISGTGIAFVILYLFHVVFMKILTTSENNFRWSKEIKKDLLLLSFIFTLSQLLLLCFPEFWTSILVFLISVFILVYSIKRLMKIFGLNSYKQVIKIFTGKIEKQFGNK